MNDLLKTSSPEASGRGSMGSPPVAAGNDERRPAGDDVKRFLRTVTELQGTRLTIDGRSLLNFSSNNYLGLARHPRVVEAVKQVVDHWGAGAASSRLISGNFIVHRDLEEALAGFLHREAALLFPTGYMANLGVITALAGPGDAVVMDRLCHASLVDAVRLSGARLFVFRHADLPSAEHALKRAKSFRRRLLVTESLFSMNGDFSLLDELRAAAGRYEALTLVDDAHAIGIWGERGRGLASKDVIASEAKQSILGRQIASANTDRPRNDGGEGDIVIGTLSKSLGSQGGFVAGSRATIDVLINQARSFIFTTGLSPACVAAAQAALSLVQEDPQPRECLKKLSASLREGLRMLGYNILGSESQIVPIVLGSAEAAVACADHLCQNGIFAPAIRPPTVHAGECRIRFSVTAEHQDEDIDQLLSALSSFPAVSGRESMDPPPVAAGDDDLKWTHE